MPRVTAKNSFAAQKAAFGHAMKLDGFLGVTRTRGEKAALIANQQAQSVLVHGDQLDSSLGQHLKYPLSCSLPVASSDKILQQFFHERGDGGIVQRANASASKNNDIQPAEQLLMVSEGLAHQALDPVALYCQTNMFFCNNQTQSWSLVTSINGKNQQLGTGDFVVGFAEYCLVV